MILKKEVASLGMLGSMPYKFHIANFGIYMLILDLLFKIWDTR